MEDDAIASSSVAEIATRSHIINAYLEDEKTIVVKLSNALTLPFSARDALVINQTTGATLAVTDVDIVQTRQVVLVGDLQHLLGAKSDWNPTDVDTAMTRVNANLYQFTGNLPAGTYNYKVAFDGTFDGALPYSNAVLTVPKGGAKVMFSYVPYDPITRQHETYDSINTPHISFPSSTDGIQTDIVAVTLADAVNVADTVVIVLNGHGQNSVMPRIVLNAATYTYTGDDLGCTYTPEATSFRLWAPTASDVQVLLYDSELGRLTRQEAMQKSEQGTWHVQVQGNIENWYYLYLLTVHGFTQTAVDPYARAISVNGLRGMVVHLATTHPDGWDTDTYKTLTHAVDAVIYELHVRDFSVHASSGMTHKGRYLAFTERGTKGPNGVVTGVDSLTQLGISHVQVLPVEEFASVDENAPDQYNWGYDPRNYNVPEGAYAMTPHGTARIREFKQLVQSLHQAQIGVIMDVVYNHTYKTLDSDFNKIVPHYYYRTDYTGAYTNGSGVGNELATERPMVQKFVRDSLKYWLQQYHIDGFRFDLMALLSVDTMKKVAEDLHALNPNVLLYGEPWTGAGSSLSGGQLVTKGQQKGLGFGVFNDDMRTALVGSMFDAHTQGFPTGAGNQVDLIKASVMGSIDHFTAAPGETINYATSHDNYTLWDKIALSNGGDMEYDRMLMDQLVQAIVLTSQGVPFIQGGDEFLRTKGGNDNSYNAGDAVNQFEWERKSQYADVFNYYASLISLRNSHPAFRLSSADDVRKHLSFLSSPDNTVAFQLAGHANGDAWANIVVIYNPMKTNVVVSLPEGSWTIVGTQGHVGEMSLGQASGTVVVPGITCEILYQG
ncbi:MAG: type I pullulanase [Ktedonobacteraceae bacterium]